MIEMGHWPVVILKEIMSITKRSKLTFSDIYLALNVDINTRTYVPSLEKTESYRLNSRIRRIFNVPS